MSFLPIDVIVDQKAKERHRVDILNLLAYVLLLILVLLFTWYFKRKRRLYVHETGLAIIFGMVLGCSLRYFGLEINVANVNIERNNPGSPPTDYITLKFNDYDKKSAWYAYEFKGELQGPSDNFGSQISYASVEPEVFFNIILPPILLNAGLSLKRRHFFRNIGAIFSYAFLGTTISVASTGLIIYESIQLIDKLIGGGFHLVEHFGLANCFYFGAIISPTDPLAILAIFQELKVDVNLFALVFGESILNDAVSIVLAHSVDQFIIVYGRSPDYPVTSIIGKCVFDFSVMFINSCLIGILLGIVTALMTKFSKLHETDLLETSLVVLTSYSSFLIAEVFDASGIVAILLCGITQAHYTINNLSFEARERLKNLFELLTFLCENFLFITVGVAFWQRNKTWDFSFVGLAFVAIILARALSIYPLTLLLNLGRHKKIPLNYQHLIAWGGAARGVISYALASRNTVGEARRIILSTTSVIVIFSVIVVGGTVESLLEWLRIPIGNSTSRTSDEDDLKTRNQGNNPTWSFRQRRGLTLPNSDSSNAIGSHQNTPLCSRQYYAQYGRHQFASPMIETPVIDVERNQQKLNCCRLRTGAPSFADSVPSISDFEFGANILEPGSNLQTERLPSLAETDSQDNLIPAAHLRCSGSDHHESSCQTIITNDDTGEQAYENASLVRRWRYLDNNFIKPILTNSQPTLMDTLPSCLSGLARFLTSDEQFMLRQMRQRSSDDGDHQNNINSQTHNNNNNQQPHQHQYQHQQVTK